MKKLNKISKILRLGEQIYYVYAKFINFVPNNYEYYMQFSSKLIQNGVDAFSSLPGIGKKSALRIILHLIQQDKSTTIHIADSLKEMIENIKHCSICHNISDQQICSICSDKRRDESLVCIVENIRDIIAIEETSQFKGVYHVLGGLISPIDGIGPNQLNIESLINRVQENGIKEVIMAVSPNIEGETTIYYISKKLKEHHVKISLIARGVSFGGDLEYADEVTLGRSIVARIPYQYSDEQ